jgi:hypothetical protein
MIIVAALLLPTAASLWLRSGGLPNLKPSTIVVVGGLWLVATAVITLNALKGSRATGTAGRLTHDLDDNRPAARVVLPAYVVGVNRQVQPWSWTTLFLAPVELLALAWSVPLAILVIMLPVGLAVSGVIWLGRLIVARL